MKDRRWVSWRDGLVLGVLVLGIVSTHWCTVNISPSIPVGLYRYVTGGAGWQRGDILALPAVPYGRSWPYRWLGLLKPVAGVPGDLVCVLEDGLWINAAWYGAVYPSWKGEKLPVFWGCYEVGEGYVFVASAMEKSLDGRYWGMTQARGAVEAKPVWTWGD